MSTRTTHAIPPTDLRRSEEGRLIGGVAAGIARHFGAEVVVVRIAFIAAVLIGGLGAVLYLLALVFLPRDGEESGMIRMPRRASLGAAFALVLIALAGSVLIEAIDLLGAGKIGISAYLISLGLIALWWREKMAESVVTQTARVTASHASPYPSSPPVTATVAAPPKGPSWTLPTVSAALVVVGVLALLNPLDYADIGPGGVLAGALAVVGIGLVASAFFARAGGLIPIGIALTLMVATLASAGTSFSGGVGERTWEPTSVGALERPYKLGAGEAQLDLTRLALPAGRTPIRVKMGAGELTILLPPDATAKVDIRVGFGNLDVFGFVPSNSEDPSYQNDEGVPATFVGERVVTDAPSTIDLEVDLGFGDVQVELSDRAPGEQPRPAVPKQPPAVPNAPQTPRAPDPPGRNP